MQDDIVCIYHKDCVDGTMAAAVVTRKFPRARAFPLAHGYTPSDIEEILNSIHTPTHIYIVDSVMGLPECVSRGYAVTVLDHHISVHEETKAFAQTHPSVQYLFDNTKSGSSLTWSYLFPDEPLPELITYIEDNDLWLQRYGEITQHVVNYLSPDRNNPKRFCELLNEDIEGIKKHGKILTQYIRTEIDRLILTEPITLRIGHHMVPMYNITDHQSVCGNILASQRNYAIGMYTILGEEVRLSFRSLEAHKPSALTYALIFGGGGHRNAAGARIKLKDFIHNIIHP
jgi:oligoribonuclease NrnB/cAMP/cGMP phosphodiesterase (DHH superfamily)